MADNLPGHSIVALRVAQPPHMGELMTESVRDMRTAVTFGVVTYLSTNLFSFRTSFLVGLLAAYYMYNDEPTPARRLAGNLYRMRPTVPLPPSAGGS